MVEQNQEMNLYQKLAKVRKQVEVIRRDKKGYGYTYVSENEILAKLSSFMQKYKLSLIPSIVHNSATVSPHCTKKTKSTNKGDIYEENSNEVLVSADMIFTWVNNDNPEERIDVPWILVGQQTDGSQSFGSGLSYSVRYFLLKFFNVATPEDDPDNWRSKQSAAAAEEDKLICNEIIKSLDETIKGFIATNPGKAETAKKFVTKYEKKGNYFAITDPILASTLLTDFKENFIVKEDNTTQENTKAKSKKKKEEV